MNLSLTPYRTNEPPSPSPFSARFQPINPNANANANTNRYPTSQQDNPQENYVQGYIFGNADERQDLYFSGSVNAPPSSSSKRSAIGNTSRFESPYNRYTQPVTPSDRRAPSPHDRPILTPLDRSDLGRSVSVPPSSIPPELPPSADIYDELYRSEPMSTSPIHKSNTPSFDTNFEYTSNQSHTVSSTNTWVTIFGFPTRDASVILRHFQEYGEIVQHSVPSGQANWIHIQYQTPVQCLRAIDRNGKIVSGYMIGVIHATEHDLEVTSKLNSDVKKQEDYNPFKRATNLPSDINLQSNIQVPKTSTSTWYKFLEYVLGW